MMMMRRKLGFRSSPALAVCFDFGPSKKEDKLLVGDNIMFNILTFGGWLFTCILASQSSAKCDKTVETKIPSD